MQDYKYLGVILDKSLSFVKHATNTIKKASHKVYLLFKLRPYLTNDACLKMYKTMVLPYIEYGDSLYACTNVALLNKIQRIRNKGLKISLKLPRDTNTLEVHRKSKLNLLKDRGDSHLLNLMHRRTTDPDYVDRRVLHTRHHDNKTLIVPRPSQNHCPWLYGQEGTPY